MVHQLSEIVLTILGKPLNGFFLKTPCFICHVNGQFAFGYECADIQRLFTLPSAGDIFYLGQFEIGNRAQTETEQLDAFTFSPLGGGEDITSPPPKGENVNASSCSVSVCARFPISNCPK